MAKVLLSWIGNTDLRAAEGDEQAGAGPIAQALKSRNYDEAFLLSNYPKKEVEPFVKWLGQQSKIKLSFRYVSLDRPTNFGKIYEAAVFWSPDGQTIGFWAGGKLKKIAA